MVYGIDYLRNKLRDKRIGVKKRYDYYNQKQSFRYDSKLIPDSYKYMSGRLGWCTKGVNALADRLIVNEWRKDLMDFNSIYALNNKDILYSSAIKSALISSCSFIYIASEEVDGNIIPRMQVIDGGNATGILDPITNMLVEGYAVLERNTLDMPTKEAYFLPHYTEYLENGEVVMEYESVAPYCCLVPVINRPDADRPFGHSQISRTCMRLTDDAIEEFIRMKISSEFYSFPQKYVLGLGEDAEFNGKEANYSNFLAFYKDDDGDRPTLGQFQTGNPTPHIEAIKAFAAQFAAEVGLTLDDLGFISANPSSAEAIKSSHESLRLMATNAQHSFGVGFLNAGFIAACLRDNIEYKRSEASDIALSWYPPFGIDASGLSGLGDALIKISQAVPDFLTKERLFDITGF